MHAEARIQIEEPFPYFFRQSLILASGLLSKLGWLITLSPRDIPVSASFYWDTIHSALFDLAASASRANIKGHAQFTRLSIWILGIELRIQVPNSKHNMD